MAETQSTDNYKFEYVMYRSIIDFAKPIGLSSYKNLKDPFKNHLNRDFSDAIYEEIKILLLSFTDFLLFRNKVDTDTRATVFEYCLDKLDNKKRFSKVIDNRMKCYGKLFNELNHDDSINSLLDYIVQLFIFTEKNGSIKEFNFKQSEISTKLFLIHSLHTHFSHILEELFSDYTNVIKESIDMFYQRN